MVEENDIVRYQGELAVIKKVFSDGRVGILPQFKKVNVENTEIVWKFDEKVIFKGLPYSRVKTFAEPGSVWLTIRGWGRVRHISIRNKYLGR